MSNKKYSKSIKPLVTNLTDPNKTENLRHARFVANNIVFGLFRKGFLAEDNGVVTVGPDEKLLLTEAGEDAIKWVMGQVYDAEIDGINYHVNQEQNKKSEKETE